MVGTNCEGTSQHLVKRRLGCFVVQNILGKKIFWNLLICGKKEILGKTLDIQKIGGKNSQNGNPLTVQKEMARGMWVRCGSRDRGTSTLHPGMARGMWVRWGSRTQYWDRRTSTLHPGSIRESWQQRHVISIKARGSHWDSGVPYELARPRSGCRPKRWVLKRIKINHLKCRITLSTG